jgi:hypothetical protein
LGGGGNFGHRKANFIGVQLGPNDPELETALEVLHLLASVPEDKLCGEFPYDDIFEVEIYKSLDIRYIESWEWQAFAAFILRNWFSRIWVVQETWAAKNLIVFVASHTILWASIIAAIRTMKESRLDELLNQQVEKTVNGDATTTRYIGNSISNLAIFDDVIRGQKELDLERLLASSRQFNATMPEDRVFAVRGMWNPGPRVKEKTDVEWLSKEVGMKVEDAYTKASVVSMREQGDVNLLSLVEDYSTRKLKNLPSWVPDYSVRPVMHPLQGIPRPDEDSQRWNASQGLDWDQLDDEAGKGGKLKVEGFHFDSIVEYAATEVEITDNHSMHTVLQLFQKALDICPNHDSRETCREEFWRALIKDTFRYKEAGPEALEAFPLLFTYHLWQMKDVMKTMQTPFFDTDTDPDYVTASRGKVSDLENIHAITQSLILDLSSRDSTSVVSSWEEMENIIELGEKLPKSMDIMIEQIAASFRSAYVGRRMFRTKENHLGIAAESIEADDQIWILPGAAAPMVLRKVDDENWKLVGEAYVYGIMNGELVHKIGDGYEMESLTLI